MPEFNEARSPLSNDNVQSWARANFTAPFRALPRYARLNWTGFGEFTMSRPIWRSLGRSTHKQLLIIGGYAPGPDIEEEPTDRVVAHVHADEAEVSFYRIAEVEDGDNLFELQPVSSTATVAFHAPFCHVGDDTGGSKAIHRVSALILYYFLAAGHVKELVRSKSDPTMFTRNFRDACLWILNGGERPLFPPTRRSNGLVNSPPLCSSVPVRPKRSSTVSSVSNFAPEESPAPPITRSATDSISVKIKRERDEDAPLLPKKYPRRTLSEQIVITKYQDSILSPRSPFPRSPAPERVNRALTDRIQHLKDENADLKDDISQLEGDKEELSRKMAKDARLYRAIRAESEQMRLDLTSVMVRLANMEDEMAVFRAKLDNPEKIPKG
ncbi:hypothetical protein BDU57DRAFT_567532 [Ampelomyces quisqualis]|uniref:Uncharacterized protein n=1 Tax=Ampelomyces quisqualis TaxID=50730 RepID=A0A6A5QU14_AMPQU|nr:hypothetical protein BDU57DRAFT_567532 [Ampelomyces quisqualis]